MTDTPKDWKCNCPMECNTLSYSFSHVSTPLDPEEECPPKVYDSTHDFLMKPFYAGWRGTTIEGRKPTQSERNSVYFLFVGSNGKIYYFYYLSRDLKMH